MIPRNICVRFREDELHYIKLINNEFDMSYIDIINARRKYIPVVPVVGIKSMKDGTFKGLFYHLVETKILQVRLKFLADIVSESQLILLFNYTPTELRRRVYPNIYNENGYRRINSQPTRLKVYTRLTSRLGTDSIKQAKLIKKLHKQLEGKTIDEVKKMYNVYKDTAVALINLYYDKPNNINIIPELEEYITRGKKYLKENKQ